MADISFHGHETRLRPGAQRIKHPYPQLLSLGEWDNTFKLIPYTQVSDPLVSQQ